MLCHSMAFCFSKMNAAHFGQIGWSKIEWITCCKYKIHCSWTCKCFPEIKILKPSGLIIGLRFLLPESCFWHDYHCMFDDILIPLLIVIIILYFYYYYLFTYLFYFNLICFCFCRWGDQEWRNQICVRRGHATVQEPIWKGTFAPPVPCRLPNTNPYRTNPKAGEDSPCQVWLLYLDTSRYSCCQTMLSALIMCGHKS